MQFNLHRYNTMTHNNKRLKLRYLADIELLKLTAQAHTVTWLPWPLCAIGRYSLQEPRYF